MLKALKATRKDSPTTALRTVKEKRVACLQRQSDLCGWLDPWNRARGTELRTRDCGWSLGLGSALAKGRLDAGYSWTAFGAVGLVRHTHSRASQGALVHTEPLSRSNRAAGVTVDASE